MSERPDVASPAAKRQKVEVAGPSSPYSCLPPSPEILSNASKSRTFNLHKDLPLPHNEHGLMQIFFQAMQTAYVTQTSTGYVTLRKLREACATWTNRRLEMRHVEALRCLFPEAIEVRWLPPKVGPDGLRLSSVEDTLGISMSYLPGPGKQRKKPNALECNQRLQEVKRRLLQAFANHPSVAPHLATYPAAQQIAKWPSKVDLEAAYDLPRSALPPRPGTTPAQLSPQKSPHASPPQPGAPGGPATQPQMPTPSKLGPGAHAPAKRSLLASGPQPSGPSTTLVESASLASSQQAQVQQREQDAAAVARARAYADERLEVLPEVAALDEGDLRERMGAFLGTHTDGSGKYVHGVEFLRRALSTQLRRDFNNDPARIEAIRMYDFTRYALDTLRTIHGHFETTRGASIPTEKMVLLLAKSYSTGGVSTPLSDAKGRLLHLCSLIPEHLTVQPATSRFPEVVRMEARTKWPALHLLRAKERELRARDKEAWFAGPLEEILRVEHLRGDPEVVAAMEAANAGKKGGKGQQGAARPVPEGEQAAGPESDHEAAERNESGGAAGSEAQPAPAAAAGDFIELEIE